MPKYRYVNDSDIGKMVYPGKYDDLVYSKDDDFFDSVHTLDEKCTYKGKSNIDGLHYVGDEAKIPGYDPSSYGWEFCFIECDEPEVQAKPALLPQLEALLESLRLVAKKKLHSELKPGEDNPDWDYTELPQSRLYDFGIDDGEIYKARQTFDTLDNILQEYR